MATDRGASRQSPAILKSIKTQTRLRGLNSLKRCATSAPSVAKRVRRPPTMHGRDSQAARALNTFLQYYRKVFIDPRPEEEFIVRSGRGGNTYHFSVSPLHPLVLELCKRSIFSRLSPSQDARIRAHCVESLRQARHKQHRFFTLCGFRRPHLPWVLSQRMWDRYHPRVSKLQHAIFFMTFNVVQLEFGGYGRGCPSNAILCPPL
jgi:hypothetical protein